jgi:hypothetical protein
MVKDQSALVAGGSTKAANLFHPDLALDPDFIWRRRICDGGYWCSPYQGLDATGARIVFAAVEQCHLHFELALTGL